MITYEAADRAAVWDIACRLREADKQEVWLASGCVPRLAVMQSLERSGRVWVASVDGTPECVFGVADAGDAKGVPWMLGTDNVVKHQRALLVNARQWVEARQAEYALLFNYVDSNNAASIRWLRYLGFQFSPAIPYGPFGSSFLPFHRQRNV